MTRRRPGTATLAAAGAVLALVAGAAAGAGVARLLADEPTAVPTAIPVPAVSPSYPADPPAEVVEDPDTPALARAVPRHAERVSTGRFGLRLPIPDGWTRSDSSSGEWKWFPPEQPPDHAFFLRVRLVSGYQPYASSVQSRIDALASAGDVDELEVESRGPDRFTATYVAQRHRRVSMERYLSFDGTSTYAVVALVGRERDRRGMAALVDRIARGARPVRLPPADS